jgi:phytoene desaturase
MMNYADMILGTWYPMGGMYKLVEAMAALAVEQGVEIRTATDVQRLEVTGGCVSHIHTDKATVPAGTVVAGADYHHVEQQLLEPAYRAHDEAYWNKRTMAPSCLLYYVGLDKKLEKLAHHNLFFDEDYDRHAASIYDNKSWPEKPLFYTCCPSVTDDTVAPAGMENLFILIPVAAGLRDSPEIRERYFNLVVRRLERFCGESLAGHIVVRESYAGSDFARDYNAFKGNAYGLANTLRQTAMLRPSMRSRKVKNLYFTGQLTVPGPGVPPAIISGQVVADYIRTQTKKQLV